MCLDYQWSKDRIKKWMEGQPKTITAYKLVKIDNSGEQRKVLPPIFTTDGPYKKTNKKPWWARSPIATARLLPNTWTKEDDLFYGSYPEYKSDYHLFLIRREAEEWGHCYGEPPLYTVLECKVPKKKVVAMGKQNDSLTIVTRKFTFVEGEEYFEEKEKVA